MRRGKEAQAIQKGRRKLSVVFETLEGFREEFRSNLVRGGLFVPTAAPFVLREEVEVSLDLAFRPGAGFRLPAEVVTVVPAELASAGATPGVALQIQLAAHEIRRRLEAVVGQVPDPDPGQQVGERRCAPRRPARVLGRLASDDASFAVRTRDLSESGVLVSVEGIPPVPVGRSVALALVHPVTGQKLEVEGTVVRHVESDGGVTALAVAFSRVQAERIEVRRFVEDLQSASHARSLAGIHGPIQEVGLAGLLQSFAAAAPRGTLTVTRNAEEGRVAFEGGELVTAVCGAVSGSKALARLLTWETGTFEFHAHLDDSPGGEPRLPLEVALLDAARQVDEARRFTPLPLRLSDRLARAPGAQPEDGPLAKTEAAILDLAGAGFTVRAILDVIPDEDHKILRALLALLERGAVTAAKS